MTQLKYFIILIFIIILSITGCSNKNSWVAEIEGEKISVDDFNVRFEFYLKQKYFQAPELIPQARNSMEERALALKDLINERLILKEAMKMKIDKKPDVKNLIRLYNQQIVINNYIETYLAPNLNVTEQEITDFYNKNKAEFKNADPDLAKKRIQYNLMMQKYERRITEILEKLKNEYRIIENENAIRPVYSEGNIGNQTLPANTGNLPANKLNTVPPVNQAPAPAANQAPAK